jgi:hypothetical protein
MKLEIIPYLLKFDDKLISLNMSGNELKQLEEPERIPNNVQGLDFSSNKITLFDGSFFVNFANLRTLSLARNLIETLEKLEFSTNQLEVLDLQNNMIKKIDLGVIFSSITLPSTKLMAYFGNNQLEDIPEFKESITNSTFMNYLDIRHNNINKNALCLLYANLSGKMPFANLDLFPQNSALDCEQLQLAKTNRALKTPFQPNTTIIGCMLISEISCQILCPQVCVTSFFYKHFNKFLNCMLGFVSIYLIALVFFNRHQPQRNNSQDENPPATNADERDEEVALADPDDDLMARTHDSINMYKTACKRSLAQRKTVTTQV